MLLKVFNLIFLFVVIVVVVLDMLILLLCVSCKNIFCIWIKTVILLDFSAIANLSNFIYIVLCCLVCMCAIFVCFKRFMYFKINGTDICQISFKMKIKTNFLQQSFIVSLCFFNFYSHLDFEMKWLNSEVKLWNLFYSFYHFVGNCFVLNCFLVFALAILFDHITL